MEIYRQVAKLLAWSMEFGASGTYPTSGFSGEELSDKSVRGRRKGQQFDHPWRPVLCDVLLASLLHAASGEAFAGMVCSIVALAGVHIFAVDMTARQGLRQIVLIATTTVCAFVNLAWVRNRPRIQTHQCGTMISGSPHQDT